MNQFTKNYISYLLFRMVGTISFVRRIEWRKILQWLNPQQDERILDVACGVGELSLQVAQRGCKVYGIDRSEEAIKFARRLSERAKIACEFEIGDAENLPYPDGYFDKIVCSSSLEHFFDDSKALREMRRVLQPNGKLVVTVDSLTYPISDDLKEKHRKICSVVRYYTREELAGSLNTAGLEMYRSEYLLNSGLTSFFFKLWIKYGQSMILWLAISLIGYPVFLVSEKLFGRQDGGYTLIAEVKKVN